MRDLRGMGETNALIARRRTPVRRATLARAALLYAERFGLPDGRIPATFEILFLTGRAPAALNAEYGTGGATGRPTR
jgi:NADH dehydrogenase [ubiquinone] 1 alpha subcomplex assembly factor 5